MKTSPLSLQLTTAVLNHFHLAPAAPDVAFLERLVDAYVRTVPWETVFRIEGDVETAVLQKFGMEKTAVGFALNAITEDKKAITVASVVCDN